ncbi:hypothetical protein FDZ73_20905, partial [bacterium]
MKRALLVCLLVALSASGVQFYQPALAAGGRQVNVDGVVAPLCLPGIYIYAPGDCLPTGPSAYLSELAQKGITLPLAPLVY